MEMRLRYSWGAVIAGRRFLDEIKMQRVKQMLRMSYENHEQRLYDARHLLSVGKQRVITIPIFIPCGMSVNKKTGHEVRKQKAYGCLEIRRLDNPKKQLKSNEKEGGK